MSYYAVIVGLHGTKIGNNMYLYRKLTLQCQGYLDPSFDDSPGLVATAGTASFMTPFMPNPPTPSKFPYPLLAVISAQSHSNVIGICHRSCGMKGCVNVFPISIGSTAPPGLMEDVRLE